MNALFASTPFTPICTTATEMSELRQPLGTTPVTETKNATNVERFQRPKHPSRAKRLLSAFFCALTTSVTPTEAADEGTGPAYEVRPIGWIRKADGKTTIEVEAQYQPALLGVEDLDAIWVLYWFDRNDTPQKRTILQVHPRGDPENPLRGVFATRAPVRPNLIALSRCRVLSVNDNRIEIDDIDAFPNTPVLDIKP
jgi:tRNA-Thr(GGU) m(6)t(6)A37 methyltransferase TsaA